MYLYSNQLSLLHRISVLAETMIRTFIFSILFLIGCTNNNSRRENQLATEMNAFLSSGIYDVQVKELQGKDKSSKPTKAQVTLTNNHGLIKFKGVDSFKDLDSIRISLNDSTLVRQFSINHFVDTITVTADKSGIDEDYFGYVFGEKYSGGIADIPEIKHLINKDNTSGIQSLFIVGRIRKDEIVIKRKERIVSSGEILMDVNKVFILTRKTFL